MMFCILSITRDGPECTFRTVNPEEYRNPNDYADALYEDSSVIRVWLMTELEKVSA